MKKFFTLTHKCDMKRTAQHSTAQHSTAQHSTAQHSTAQHSTAQHSTASLLKDKSGLILIAAMMIFFLLIITSLTLQQTVVDTYQNVRNWNNHYAASDASFSATEYLQYKLKNYEPGYNEKVKCVYENLGLTEVIPDSPEARTDCLKFENIILNNNVKIEWEVKGRADDDEILLTGGSCGGNRLDSINQNSCYVVPFPGTGSAGKHCDLYNPDFYNDADGDGDDNTLVSGFGIGDEPPDQLDFACNWNKLMFGGSQLDRVSIPLYYDDGLVGIISPFATGDATRFYLRMRTPCLPCVYEDDEVDVEINRLCERGKNKTVCDNDERYVLDDEGGYGDIVVQWQLTGQCEVDGVVEECGLVPIPDPFENSAIFEKRINENLIVLRFDSKGYRTDVHENIETYSYEILRNMTTPTLTLFLNSALISEAERNVPYLEYQILTDKPIGNPVTAINIDANVEGIHSRETLYKSYPKSVIDFAVQN